VEAQAGLVRGCLPLHGGRADLEPSYNHPGACAGQVCTYIRLSASIAIINQCAMLNTQGRRLLPNTAANPLLAAENSAAGQFGQIGPKTLISRKFLALRGCFLTAGSVFSLMTGKWPTEPRPVRTRRPDRASVGRGERPAEASQWI